MLKIKQSCDLIITGVSVTLDRKDGNQIAEICFKNRSPMYVFNPRFVDSTARSLMWDVEYERELTLEEYKAA